MISRQKVVPTRTRRLRHEGKPKGRSILSESQKEILLKTYEQQKQPPQKVHQQLAERIPELSISQIKVWFQNMRAKERKLGIFEEPLSDQNLNHVSYNLRTSIPIKHWREYENQEDREKAKKREAQRRYYLKKRIKKNIATNEEYKKYRQLSRSRVSTRMPLPSTLLGGTSHIQEHLKVNTRMKNHTMIVEASTVSTPSSMTTSSERSFETPSIPSLEYESYSEVLYDSPITNHYTGPMSYDPLTPISPPNSTPHFPYTTDLTNPEKTHLPPSLCDTFNFPGSMPFIPDNTRTMNYDSQFDMFDSLFGYDQSWLPYDMDSEMEFQNHYGVALGGQW